MQERHQDLSFNYFSKDRKGNCQPGTTIDQEVCHPTMFDYYQFSHAAIQVHQLCIVFFNDDVSSMKDRLCIKKEKNLKSIIIIIFIAIVKVVLYFHLMFSSLISRK